MRTSVQTGAKCSYLAVIVFFSSFCLLAQKTVPGTFFHNIEKTSDSSTLFFYNSIASPTKKLEVLDLVSRISFNSTYPRGFNDGAVWKGKGFTFEMHAGISGRIGKLSYQIQPIAYAVQNSNFERAPFDSTFPNEYTYQFGRIDWVQQYGSGPKLFFHPGQSEVKFQTGKFIAALSTQNYSIGPSFFNPVLMSQQGPGFPHLRLGSEPFQLGEKIGTVELNWLIGLLRESSYFDLDSGNDLRFFNAAFLNYAPAFLKNFKLGLGRVLYKQTQFFAPEDLLSTVLVLESDTREDVNTGNDTFDQMASAFLEWSFPQIGFRAFAEFAKNDFTGGIRWTLIEPEHTRGFTLGFEKILETKNKREVRFLYEHTTLSINQAFLWRATPSFYQHGVNRQGYTHLGQLIGAGIGPGGNSDNVLIRIKNLDNSRLALSFQRIENNRDSFVRSEDIRDIDNHDVEYTAGFSFLKSFGKVELVSEVFLSRNFNRYYDADDANLYVMIGTSIDL